MILLSIILILTIAVLILTRYKQLKTNEQFRDEITTNTDSIYELESFTYHSESEIKDWIEDSVRELEYTVEENTSNINNLQEEAVTFDDLETTKKNIEDSEDRIIKKVKLIQERLQELFPEEDNEVDKAELAMDILEKHKDIFNHTEVKELSIKLDDDEEYTIVSEDWEVKDNA